MGDNFPPSLEPRMGTRAAWAPGSLASDRRVDWRGWRAGEPAGPSGEGLCPAVTAGHKLRGAGRRELHRLSWFPPQISNLAGNAAGSPGAEKRGCVEGWDTSGLGEDQTLLPKVPSAGTLALRLVTARHLPSTRRREL